MPKVIAPLVVMALAFGAARSADECSTEPDHVSQRACLERVASQSMADLEAAEQAAKLRIERWDEEPEYRTRSLGLFEAAERHFTEYRTAQCDLAASRAAGGNGAHDMRLLCQIQLNRAHILEVNDLW